MIDENYEDGAKIELGKENELLPSGRMKPLIEMFIEDKQSNSKALDDIDSDMETNPYESQMVAAGMGTKREVVELDGEKFFVLSQSNIQFPDKQHITILYAQDRFLVNLKGESTILTVQLAQKIVKSLNFSAELFFPEKKPEKRSSANAMEDVMTAAYAPMMKEAENMQVEIEQLEKLHAEGKITADEYQKQQMEMQKKAIAISQKFMGAGVAQQMNPVQSQVCPKCGKPVGKAKFCPECGTKLMEETKCSNCGTILKADQKFCPECGVPRTEKKEV